MTKEICHGLELFYGVTALFSGTLYPTSNVYFLNICEVRIALRERRSDPNVIIQQMVTTMIAKFDKYWGVINRVMIVGTILNPGYKMLLLNYFFARIYGDDAEYEIQKVKNMCRDLVNEYENQSKERGAGSLKLDVTNTIGRKNNWRSDFALFVNEKSAYMTSLKMRLGTKIPSMLEDNDVDAVIEARRPGIVDSVINCGAYVVLTGAIVVDKGGGCAKVAANSRAKLILDVDNDDLGAMAAEE
ncbi:AC transposase [Canna indica]|uniref:AC transposase n=1 Tax=Canna indica TaxID=4628 RepID=A0AAQ3KCG0_9LILI|nr:AC transposase [Canna indica]